jgi:hypothetical protein
MFLLSAVAQLSLAFCKRAFVNIAASSTMRMISVD